MSQEITKQQAKKQKLPRYFTGIPCSKGHVAERITATGACTICFSEYQAKYYMEHRQQKAVYDKAHRKQRRKLQPSSIIYSLTKSRAKKSGIMFNIEESDVSVPDICPILKIPLFFSEGERTDNSPSIDRIDNTKGYVKGNVQVISWRANKMKVDGTLEELMLLGKWAQQQLETV